MLRLKVLMSSFAFAYSRTFFDSSSSGSGISSTLTGFEFFGLVRPAMSLSNDRGTAVQPYFSITSDMLYIVIWSGLM